MKPLLSLVLLSVFVCVSGISRAEKINKFDYDGSFSFSMNHLPTFEEFPEVELPKLRAEDIDWKSHPGAWSFRTRLKEGLDKGPNFAGKYVVVTIGCGSPCQENWVINSETGKIIGIINSSFGVSYRLNSRMLIRHLPRQETIDYEQANSATFGTIDYYLIVDDQLQEILKIHPPIIDENDAKNSSYRNIK